MTAIDLIRQVSERGDAIRLINDVLARLYWSNKINSFIALDNVRAYLIAESHKDLTEAKQTWKH